MGMFIDIGHINSCCMSRPKYPSKTCGFVEIYFVLHLLWKYSLAEEEQILISLLFFHVWLNCLPAGAIA